MFVDKNPLIRKSLSMQFRTPRILKAIAVLVIALAWFAGTNHCSLGAAFEGTDGKGADGNGTSAPICHCAEHGKTSGAQSQGASAMLTCCQGLLSPSVELTQPKLKASLTFLGFHPPFLIRPPLFQPSHIPNFTPHSATRP